jgi:predicted transcriptional regulator
MTELLEKAVEVVRRLAPEAQDDIARVMLRLTGQEEEPEPIEPDDVSAVLEGLAHAERGEFAGDAEVEAAFRRFS